MSRKRQGNMRAAAAIVANFKRIDPALLSHADGIAR